MFTRLHRYLTNAQWRSCSRSNPVILASALLGFLTVVSCSKQAAETAKVLPPEEPQAASSWSILGNGHEQRYFSQANAINTANVKDLGIAWYADIPIRDALIGNALVADGMIYQSGPGGVAYAHDLATGELRWQYNAGLKFGANVVSKWGSRVHRGLALWEDKVIFPTGGDCKLNALDRFTGELIWSVQSCDPEEFYYISAAPRVGNGMVFTGNACADAGLNRGFVDAFDANTGEKRWRFYTVPGAPPADGYQDPVMEMASKTWGSGEWWKQSMGCASVWEGINYDEETNLVYVGTAGPAPWNPSERGKDAGDELFTNSIVALNADTGEYVWHYKTVPNDGWNHDASNQMIVTDLVIDGHERRVLMAAPKSGFFYLLDAATGEFISANNFVPVNWTKGIDPETGRPIPSDEAKWWLKPEGAEVLPSPAGGRSWQSMSYNPKTGLVYIPATHHSAKYKVPEIAGLGAVESDYYIARKGESKYEAYGALIAWDPVAQKEVWRGRQRPLPINGGIISTAGDLVFQATAEGEFEAYDAASGELLWAQSIGAVAAGSPTTVEVDGEQVVLLPVGNGLSGMNMMYPVLGTMPSTRAPSRLLAFKLGGEMTLPPTEIVKINKPDMPKQPDDLARKGLLLGENYLCVACHGVEGVGLNGSVPDLRNSKLFANLDALRSVVKDGVLAARGMPQFPDITDEELTAIQAYVVNSAWRSYELQQNGQLGE